MNRLCILIILSLGILAISCSKEEDSTDGSASFLGDYIGDTYYYSTNTEITRQNSLVRVYKGTSNYNFKFFNGITEITNVKMKQKNDSTWISSDTTGTIDISIVRDTLNLNYSLSGANWTINNAIRK